MVYIIIIKIIIIYEKNRVSNSLWLRTKNYLRNDTQRPASRYRRLSHAIRAKNKNKNDSSPVASSSYIRRRRRSARENNTHRGQSAVHLPTAPPRCPLTTPPSPPTLYPEITTHIYTRARAHTMVAVVVVASTRRTVVCTIIRLRACVPLFVYGGRSEEADAVRESGRGAFWYHHQHHHRRHHLHHHYRRQHHRRCKRSPGRPPRPPYSPPPVVVGSTASGDRR